VSEVSLSVDESCQQLLSSFWDENRKTPEQSYNQTTLFNVIGAERVENKYL
jgi:hypothetical protein